MKSDTPFLKHIIDSSIKIETFLENINRTTFHTNEMMQSATIREIEVIGEAVKNISKQTINNHPEVEWKIIARTRDKMIHHYFGINLDTVYSIATKDIPVLKKQIAKILKEKD